jgi:hypothetical protein
MPSLRLRSLGLPTDRNEEALGHRRGLPASPLGLIFCPAELLDLRRASVATADSWSELIGRRSAFRSLGKQLKMDDHDVVPHERRAGEVLVFESPVLARPWRLKRFPLSISRTIQN